MQKLSAANYDCGILSENNTVLSSAFDGGQNLVSSIGTFRTNPFGVLIMDCDLPDRKAMDIAVKLALAIDKNSPEEIRFLKAQYGSNKEFASAKEYLDKKSKQVWDVFSSRDTKMRVPREAMKALGVTNLPSLDFMLGDSVRLFESDGSSTTVDIIRSVLTNKNLNYTFDDVYDYLLFAHKKYCCFYNLKTVTYLIEWLDCDVEKLNALGVDNKTITKALESFSFIAKLKYLFKGGLKLSVFPL